MLMVKENLVGHLLVVEVQTLVIILLSEPTDILTENVTIGSSQGDEFRAGFTASPVGGFEIANGITVTMESNGSWVIL